MKTGENIKKMRKEKGMTQKQLAENSGLAVTTIQQYEAGKYEPKNASLIKLASALDCDISDLNDSYAISNGLTQTHKELKEYTSKELLEELLRREGL